MIARKPVHDLRGPAAAVKDVAHQMQVIDNQALDQVGKRADKVLTRIGLEDRIDDTLVIANAVVVLVPGACAAARR